VNHFEKKAKSSSKILDYSKTATTMRCYLLKLMTFAGLLLFSGCVAYTDVEPVAIAPMEGELKTLALLRPTWDGTRPDSFCAPYISDDIEWQLKQSIRDRGFQVLAFEVPALENSYRPDPVASWSSDELFQLAPESADAVLRLRIVEYLDSSLCDSGYEAKFLAITAIAEIFARNNGQLVWQTRQVCSDLSGSTKETVYNCTVELAQKIAARLPLADRRLSR
jgi:hypothetical protein